MWLSMFHIGNSTLFFFFRSNLRIKYSTRNILYIRSSLLEFPIFTSEGKIRLSSRDKGTSKTVLVSAEGGNAHSHIIRLVPTLLTFCHSIQPTSSTLSSFRRCRALYDCEADNEDELSFREGEVIIVTNEQTDDDNWMEGALERAPERRGMFPISFVHMLQD